MPLPSCTPDVNDTTKPDDSSYQYCLAAEIRALKTALINSDRGKNLLINGAMRVSQRGTSASVSGTDVFVCDRWRTQTNGGGTITLTKDATSSLQQRHFLRSDYSSGTVSSVIYRQRIEAKEVNGLHIVGSVTASLKAYQNTGSSQAWTISLYKPTAGEDSYSSGETLISSQNITVGSDSWASHSVTFSGLVEADVINGLSFRITTGALTSGKANGISEVQLEPGSVATGFERRPYGLELALCQRYYWRILAGTNAQNFGYGFSETTTAGQVGIQWPVTMRSAPTLETTGTAADYQVREGGGGSVVNCNAVPTISGATTTGASIVTSVAAGLIGRGQYLRASNTSAYLGFLSEL